MMDYKSNYLKWLNANITEEKVSTSVTRIILPFLDRNNDFIEIFIRAESDGSFTLTDDAETISELEFSGLNLLGSPKRKNIFNMIISSHGVACSPQNELYVNCQKEELPLRKHMLAQCMVKISDMFYLSRPQIQNLFIEDVTKFLDENNIRFTPDVSFTGKSKLITNYDFCIPKSSNAPERIIKVVNNIDRSKSESVMFLWGDTREARKSESTLFVFIGNEKTPSKDILSAMQNYDINPVLWGERNKYIAELSK